MLSTLHVPPKFVCTYAERESEYCCCTYLHALALVLVLQSEGLVLDQLHCIHAATHTLLHTSEARRRHVHTYSTGHEHQQRCGGRRTGRDPTPGRGKLRREQAKRPTGSKQHEGRKCFRVHTFVLHSAMALSFSSFKGVAVSGFSLSRLARLLSQPWGGGEGDVTMPSPPSM